MPDDVAAQWLCTFDGRYVRFRLDSAFGVVAGSELLATVVAESGGSRMTGTFRITSTFYTRYTLLWLLAPGAFALAAGVAALVGASRGVVLFGWLAILTTVLDLGPVYSLRTERLLARNREASLVAALDGLLEAEPRREPEVDVEW